MEVGCVANVLGEHTVSEPSEGSTLIMKHCENNINLYHY
jgi:hypothetical protein